MEEKNKLKRNLTDGEWDERQKNRKRKRGGPLGGRKIVIQEMKTCMITKRKNRARKRGVKENIKKRKKTGIQEMRTRVVGLQMRTVCVRLCACVRACMYVCVRVCERERERRVLRLQMRTVYVCV